MNATIEKPATAREAAQAMVDAFTIGTRDDGATFVHLRGGSPEWMTDVIRAAHGDMFPDDWRYQFISDACDIIADGRLDDGVEADVYTSDLTRWLASRNDRFAYCDEYVSDFGDSGADTLQRISGGQYTERYEVLHLVAQALEA